VSERRRCAVVGAGLLGLAAACSMGRRGWDTVVFEAAAAPGHERSGSKGDARIFRLGYPDALYVEMAMLARTAWRELEAATGAHLLHVTGQLTFGSELGAIAHALRACGVAAEALSQAEAARRCPGIVPPGPVLFEPDSGVLAAGRCLDALRIAGRFELCTKTDVVALEDDPGAAGVTVVLAGGATQRADVVVNCAGPRALALLAAPDSRPPPLAAAAPSLPQVAYFARRDPVAPLPPVFIEWGPDMIYGLPVPDDSGGLHAGTYKVSHHTPGTPFDPTDPDPLPFQDDATLLEQLTDAAGRLLPALDPAPVATERCVYDNTVDSDFVLDRVGRIVVGCGTSGHAFKFGPLLGELLADLAEGRTPPLDLSRFSLARRPR
jgi:glycine/D-amino acid oxidase-like deaminating enzyme